MEYTQDLCIYWIRHWFGFLPKDRAQTCKWFWLFFLPSSEEFFHPCSSIRDCMQTKIGMIILFNNMTKICQIIILSFLQINTFFMGMVNAFTGDPSLAISRISIKRMSCLHWFCHQKFSMSLKVFPRTFICGNFLS